MNRIFLLFSIIAVFVLTACGGGGGSSPTSDGATTHSISGATRWYIQGVTLNLTGQATASTTSIGNGNLADRNGYYTFSGLANGSYTVTPSLYGYTFNPPSITVLVNGFNKTDVNFVATQNQTYGISGDVIFQDLYGGSPVNVTILAYVNGVYAGQNDLTWQRNYSFSGFYSGDVVTLTASGYTGGMGGAGGGAYSVFTPASYTITIGNSNVILANFTCSSNCSKL